MGTKLHDTTTTINETKVDQNPEQLVNGRCAANSNAKNGPMVMYSQATVWCTAQSENKIKSHVSRRVVKEVALFSVLAVKPSVQNGFNNKKSPETSTGKQYERV
jgi:hypothetical protein